MKHLLLSLLFAPTALLAQQLGQIESVEYDPVNARFLVSNATEVVVVDGYGEPTGVVGGDASASYGMEVMGNLLFTIDNNRVKAFELTTGMQQMSLTITGATFLNGMASNGSDQLWVSDFSGKRIYAIDVSDILNPTYTTLVTFPSSDPSPNGLLYEPENNRLLFVTWGAAAKVKAIDLATNAITQLFSGTNGNMDGIDRDAYGHYFISSWAPSSRITRYDSDFTNAQTITVSNLLQPADIAYATEIDTLIIPSVGNSNVYFVGFPNAASVRENTNTLELSLFPNPTAEVATLRFHTPTGGEAHVEIMDMQGRSVLMVHKGTLPAGEQVLVFPVDQLTAGKYTLRLVMDGMETSTIGMVKMGE
jgi:hypothetical protein